VIDRIRRAYLWACTLDVVVRKPGNVSVASPGHGMRAEQFIASARVSAGALCEPGARVGKRIEGAIAATHAAVACNTNLGIVLLCAPLAAAAECADGAEAGLRARLCDVLRRLDLEDARATYRAIAIANPGGLGAASQQDVRQAPSVDLRAAMQLAADRDRIARAYGNDFADVFELGLPEFVRRAETPAVAMLASYLVFLASAPDSHIVRKSGAALAQTVTKSSAALLEQWRTSAQLPDAEALAAWDERLKGAGLNPGTSADLAVASAFVAAMADPRLCEVPMPALAWNVLNTGPTLTRLSG
jgi:triphosphoribosyl-dephospho-CoA synthase